MDLLETSYTFPDSSGQINRVKNKKIIALVSGLGVDKELVNEKKKTNGNPTKDIAMPSNRIELLTFAYHLQVSQY